MSRHAGEPEAPLRHTGVAGVQVGAWALALVVITAVGVLAVVARVAQLQVRPERALEAHIGPRVATRPDAGRRGDILDRRGRVLASTRFAPRAFVDPQGFDAERSLAHLTELSRVLGVPLEEIGPRVIRAMAHNERVAAVAGAAGGGESGVDGMRGVAGVVVGGGVGDEPGAQVAARPIRYVPLTRGAMDEAVAEAVGLLKIPGVHIEMVPVRQQSAEGLVGALVGRVGAEPEWNRAAEGRLHERLEPSAGSFAYVHDARGRPMWIEPGAYRPARRGEDARLSVDLELQRIVVEELARGVAEANAQGGRAVLLDPHTGEVLALHDIIAERSDLTEYDWKTLIPRDKLGGPRYRVLKPDPARAGGQSLARARAIEDIYEPGSTFKPFVWSAVTDARLATESETLQTHGGTYTTPYGRTIRDVVRRGSMTWTEVLINSSNIGMVQAAARMGFGQLRAAVLGFGFGQRTGLPLAGESGGLVTGARAWTKYTQTSVAIGHEVAVTPVQMVRGFSAFARRGEHAGTIPKLTLWALDTSGEGALATAAGLGATAERAVSAGAALRTRQAMRGVTANLDRRMKQQDPTTPEPRYELFGKSGTAEIPMGDPPAGKRRPRGSDGYFRGQYYSSFIAAGPHEDPRLVCLVIIDDPGPELIPKKAHYGSWVAGPVVRRVMERSLAYLGVPASPPLSERVIEQPGG